MGFFEENFVLFLNGKCVVFILSAVFKLDYGFCFMSNRIIEDKIWLFFPKSAIYLCFILILKYPNSWFSTTMLKDSSLYRRIYIMQIERQKTW